MKPPTTVITDESTGLEVSPPLNSKSREVCPDCGKPYDPEPCDCYDKKIAQIEKQIQENPGCVKRLPDGTIDLTGLLGENGVMPLGLE